MKVKKRDLFLLKKLKEKKGGSTIVEVLICISLITFILFFPIAIFSLSHKQNLIEDDLALGLQMVSTEGGLTDRVEDIIYSNLEAKGLLPKNCPLAIKQKVKIICDADARGGNTSALKYRDGADPKITLEIWYPADAEVNLLNGLSRMIGASDTMVPFDVGNGQVQWYYKFSGKILSEKIDY